MSIATHRMDGTMPPKPWYRQLWPWLLMTMPAIALVGGAVTFWLAATSNNALVVDDYYREGKAINLELARDRKADQLGLAAELSRGPDAEATLRISANPGVALPPFVTLRLIHATRAELDRTISLSRVGAGSYAAPQAQMPETGRWNVVIEDPDRSWRLVGTALGLTSPLRIGGDVH
jgi:hypothetical protein